MRESGRSALAKWAWRGKGYVVHIRPSHDGMVLQQLLYAGEVGTIGDLGIELAPVGAPELDLALRLIAQIAEDAYDPHRFVDAEKQRFFAAVERKIAGRKVVARPVATAPSAQVIGLVAALRASLGAAGLAPPGMPSRAAAPRLDRERKPVRRAAKTAAKAAEVPATPAARPRRRQSGR